MATRAPHLPVCLLSLDGGGIKGISELLILQHIMVAVQGQLGLADEPLPCDYFDLVGGTSTGGLITIMLVRLRMTASAALNQYFDLAGKIFSKRNTKKGKEGAFKASTLEASIKKIVSDQEKKHSNGGCMLPTSDNNIRAKGFVCAMAAEHMKKPYHLKTYKVSGEIQYDCEIWEAARATTAAPTYFKAVSIKWPNGSSNRFVDAGLGFNNPTEEVIEEAETIFGTSTPLRVLVSLGCGVKTSIRYDAPSAIDRFLPVNAIKTVQAIATDCEKTSQNLERYFKHHKNVYFRFNIPEIGDIGLSEVDKSTLDRISASTKAYFDVGSAGHVMLGPVVNLLCEGARGAVPSHGITLGKIRHQVLPFSRNTDFVGRGFYLKQLIAKLDPRSFAGTCPRVALDGLGGVGKTQIALQFAYQIQETSLECSVFWVQASDATTFNNSYREIAQKLGILGVEDDKADIKQLVLTALEGLPNPWLLVVDNADDYKVLSNADERIASRALIEFLPNRGNGAVLFTTRDNKAATAFAEANVIHVEKMSREESIKLLRKSVHVQKHSLLDDKTSTTELLDLLFDLPLAIKQGAAYINTNSTPISKYLSLYKGSEKEIIEVLSKDFGDRGRYSSQQNPVAKTWLISFEQILRQEPLAAEYLSLIGIIIRENIPISLLPPGKSLLKQEDAIGTLTAYSFVTRRITEDAFDVHRLVHLATRNWLEETNGLSIWADKALNRLVEVIPAGGHTNREVWIRYLPHGIYLADTIKVLKKNEITVIKLLDQIGRCQFSVGQYIEAEKMHQRTMALRVRIIGKNHPDTLISMNELGVALSMQGRYDAAEPIYRETLQLMEKVLGKEHPQTLTSMNNLAGLLKSQGRYDAAEPIYRETLQLREMMMMMIFICVQRVPSRAGCPETSRR
ncbi:hypothetical protein V502_01323, partial [Pseudogymnoascus sp. VKM F-4520 (FW-2644)]